MTLYTDRLTIQTTNIDRDPRSAPTTSPSSAARATTSPTSTGPRPSALGLVEVWSDARWILWRVPEPTVVTGVM